MELRRNTHHVYRLMYHFVWIPKYRHKVFSEPYREVQKGIIQKAAYDYDIDIVELEIPTKMLLELMYEIGLQNMRRKKNLRSSLVCFNRKA